MFSQILKSLTFITGTLSQLLLMSLIIDFDLTFWSTRRMAGANLKNIKRGVNALSSNLVIIYAPVIFTFMVIIPTHHNL